MGVSSILVYATLFHSNPILEIFKELDGEYKMIIDIIRISDKLSSYYIKGYMLNQPFYIELYQLLINHVNLIDNTSQGMHNFKLASFYAQKSLADINTTDIQLLEYYRQNILKDSK